MNKNDKQKNAQYRIEDLAKEFFGYDEESLLKEYESAEEEAALELAADPRDDLKAGAGFEALMQRIREQNIEPVYQEDYEKKTEASKRKPIRLKAMWKPLLVAALAATMLLGSGVVVFGKKSYFYWERQVGGNKPRTVWNNVNDPDTFNQLELAYSEIEDKLGIYAIDLTYIPNGMSYQGLDIEKGRAVIKFLYKEKVIILVQMKLTVEQSYGLDSDMLSSEKFYNEWIGEEIEISKNILNDRETEFRATLVKRDTLYYLCGIMNEEEFKEILEGWTFPNN